MKNTKKKGIYYYATHWRMWYVLLLVGLINLYPVAVSDGQGRLSHLFDPEALQKIIEDRFDIKGIDISHHNQDIDWETLTGQSYENRPHFCFMKATEGGDFVDKHFRRNWENARNVKIAIGAYHFYRPEVSPEIQAQNFITNVRLEEGDFAPVLDFELQGRNRRHYGNITANLKKWLDIVEEAYGVQPIIYTNLRMYERYIKGTELEKYPIWASQYNTESLMGFENANVLFWQHSQTGRTAGIRGHVDLNVYMGSYLDLFSLKIQRKNATLTAEKPA